MDILIPCKAYARGKSRLAGLLTGGERAALCRRLLRHTLTEALATGGRVAVVTDDPAVAGDAVAAGARVLDDPGTGLNAALALAEASLGRAAALAVVPIDLPGLTAARLSALAGAPGVTLVADRHGTGTNLLLLDPLARPRFGMAFGAGSLARHSRQARAMALPLRILRDPVLGLDLDTPDDLAVLSRGPTILTEGTPHEAA